MTGRETALVTGGAGFIGSTLVSALRTAGYRIVVVDDLSSGDPSRIPDDAELIQHDIADPGIVGMLAKVRPSIVAHAAAQISVTRSVSDPERDRAINVGGTRHILEAVRASARRFVFISSGGAVYGEADGATEDWPARPLSPYGRNKLAAETLVRESHVPYAIARPSNVYGPGQRSDQEGGVVAIFAAAVRAGDRPAIFGDGEQARDFVHVDDVVGALVALAKSSASGTWNVATGEATTIHGLLSTIEAVSGRAIGHVHRSERAGEIRISRLDIGRIRSQIGWHPRLSLADGLATVVGPTL